VLGWTFVFGFSVLSIGLFTNYKIAKRFGELREAYMKKQDARMDLTNETLQNIKIIKIYGWIEIFLKNIYEKRK
jgi:hypothetical protein